jgi:hypothetical protein
VQSGKITYTGVVGAVAGVVGFVGIYQGWFTNDATSVTGTADVSGKLAWGMALGTFVFGGAYILITDVGIRRAMGALMTLCAVILTLACVWGLTRAGDVGGGGYDSDTGLLVSTLGGVLGICAGFLALRQSMKADAGEPSEVSPPE